MSKMRKGRKQLMAEEFVRIWQTSNSVQEVAEKTGYKSTTLSVKANSLRRMGIPLKKYSRNTGGGSPRFFPRKEDTDRIDALKLLAEAYQKDTSEESNK